MVWSEPIIAKVQVVIIMKFAVRLLVDFVKRLELANFIINSSFTEVPVALVITTSLMLMRVKKRRSVISDPLHTIGGSHY